MHWVKKHQSYILNVWLFDLRKCVFLSLFPGIISRVKGVQT